MRSAVCLLKGYAKKNNEGFTLIETLVSINLAMLTVTFILSFFLFANKFFVSSIKNVEGKHLVLDSFNKMEKMISTSPEFNLIAVPDSIILSTDDNRRVYFLKEMINLNSLYDISDVDSCSVQAALLTGEMITITNHDERTEKDTISSKDIYSLQINLKRHQKYFGIKIYNPAYSKNRFRNI